MACEDFHNLYLPNIVRMIWMEYLAHMREWECIQNFGYKIYVILTMET
jgi:hypothetical protein